VGEDALTEQITFLSVTSEECSTVWELLDLDFFEE
jgi:hypothetical protein